ncbi:MAG: glycosyltransferase family 9 protein [Cystobacterineae bacterium]|nr:glycosyltransferase family 9 protein [Cystobacterineae bacterium]
MHKRPELWAKAFAGKLAATLLWRPKRRWGAQNLSQVHRLLLVRVDNRVGEALLMTPLLEALAPHAQVDLLVHEKTARVLEGHPLIAELFSLSTKALRFFPLSKEVSRLRTHRWELVVNCTNWSSPSTTASLLSRWIAPYTPVVGPACGIAKALADIAVPRREDTCSELLQRLHLLGPLGLPLDALPPLSFRKPRLSPAFAKQLSHIARPFALVNPGSRLLHRRVPQKVFVHLCEAILKLGYAPLVTWGPQEETLARQLVDKAPGSLLAPPTNLDELAALMQAARFVVSNNTGPMHLSVAVGAPTLALFFHMPMERWGHRFSPHHCVDLGPYSNNVDAMAKLAVQGLVQFYEGLCGGGSPPEGS